MFPTVENALAGYASASQQLEPADNSTHEMEWRFIFHDRDSRRAQLIGLLFLPFGHIHTAHAVFRFKTRHRLTPGEARKLFFGRALGGVAYHACFVGIILSGVGVLIAAVPQLITGFSLNLTLLAVAALSLALFLIFLSAKTRSLGLFGPARTIAKDGLDLLSIRSLGRPGA